MFSPARRPDKKPEVQPSEIKEPKGEELSETDEGVKDIGAKKIKKESSAKKPSVRNRITKGFKKFTKRMSHMFGGGKEVETPSAPRANEPLSTEEFKAEKKALAKKLVKEAKKMREEKSRPVIVDVPQKERAKVEKEEELKEEQIIESWPEETEEIGEDEPKGLDAPPAPPEELGPPPAELGAPPAPPEEKVPGEVVTKEELDNLAATLRDIDAGKYDNLKQEIANFESIESIESYVEDHAGFTTDLKQKLRPGQYRITKTIEDSEVFYTMDVITNDKTKMEIILQPVIHEETGEAVLQVKKGTIPYIDEEGKPDIKEINPLGVYLKPDDELEDVMKFWTGKVAPFDKPFEKFQAKLKKTEVLDRVDDLLENSSLDEIKEDELRELCKHLDHYFSCDSADDAYELFRGRCIADHNKSRWDSFRGVIDGSDEDRLMQKLGNIYTE